MLPLVESRALCCDGLIWAGPTFRKDFPQLATKGHTNTTSEASFDTMKHTDREVGARKAMRLVPFIASQTHTMIAQDKATAVTRLAAIGDPVTRRRVQNALNSRAGAASAAAAAAVAAAASGAAPAATPAKPKKAPVTMGDIISAHNGNLSGPLRFEGMSPWGPSASRGRLARRTARRPQCWSGRQTA